MAHFSTSAGITFFPERLPMPPIPEWLGGATGWLGGIAAIVLVVTFFVKHTLPGLKSVAESYGSMKKFLVAWNGTLAEHDHSGKEIEPAVPGVIARLQDLETGVSKIGGLETKIEGLEGQIEKIHHEVTPNHGGSIKDEVGRVEAAVNDVATKLTEHITIAKESDRSQAEMARQVESLASRWAEN